MITCRLSLRWQKTVKVSNQFNVKCLQSVPAKALLFGEYGLLKGGSAAVVLLPNFKVQVQFALSRAVALEPSCTLRSGFLESDVILFGNMLQRSDVSQLTGEQRNFYCYLSQYLNELVDSTFLAEITKAYSPAYGFGSSSAIQAAFHLFFQTRASAQKIHFAELGSDFWKRVYASLKLLQGQGSCYDVASQIYGALLDSFEEPLLVSFKDLAKARESENHDFLPQIAPLKDIDLKKFGCFVETGIRSDTRAVLKSQHTRNLDNSFFDLQTRFASAFIAEPHFNTAAELCRASSEISLQYGLLPQTPELLRFTSLCTQLHFPWKTMGAGFGDCLWVMASRDEISQLLQDPGMSGLRIRFAFEDV